MEKYLPQYRVEFTDGDFITVRAINIFDAAKQGTAIHPEKEISDCYILTIET